MIISAVTRNNKYNTAIQFDLFEAVVVLPEPSPFDSERGKVLRDEGIDQAVSHAEQEIPGWADIAYNFLLTFISKHNGTFMAEEVRVQAELNDVPVPPSLRAWGSVIARAAKNELIKRVGYRQVRNVKAHCTPATLWIALSKRVV